MNDDQSIIEFKTSEKMNLLMETLEEIQGKVIIWANYTHNIKQIEKALKIKYGDKSTVSFLVKETHKKELMPEIVFKKILKLDSL